MRVQQSNRTTDDGFYSRGMDSLTAAADLVSAARRVAVLTGAGVSAESGLATFRGAGGWWRGRAAVELATPQAFAADPVTVWAFYNHRRQLARAAAPNSGHLALRQLARKWPTTLITQNVDRLHRRAGSENVVELHGNLEDVRCTGCGQTFHRPDEDLPDLPACDACGGLLRPAVVWFGEALPEGVFEAATEAVESADVLLVVGTSSVVYPAAGLSEIARAAGAKTIEVNPEPGGGADVTLAQPAGKALPELVGRLA